MSDHGGTFIYFMRPVGRAGPVKIGCSVTPGLRATNLATFGADLLEILVTFPGDLELERNLHECFLDCHSHREWFHASPRLLRAIEAMQAGVPVERAVDLSKRLGTLKRAKRGPQATSEAKQERAALSKRKTALTSGTARRLWPADLDALMIHSMRHVALTDVQRARFEEVLANPSQHLLTLEEYVPAVHAYRAWLATASEQAVAA